MIYNNPFQEMLLDQLRKSPHIIVDERLMPLYFPHERHEDLWFRWRGACISEGLTVFEIGGPWDEEACRIFCSRNNIIVTINYDGEVGFLLRGD